MKVLEVIAELGTGGAEAVAADICVDLAQHGHEVTVVSAGGWRAAELQTQGVRLVEAPLRSRAPWAAAKAWSVLRQEAAGVDVVHAHNARVAAVARAAIPRRVPMVVTAHGFPRHGGQAAGLLRRTDALVVAVSEQTREDLVASGVPADRIQVVENAVHPLPKHVKRVARSKLGLEAGEKVVLCAARFTPEKRHDLLLEAWRRWPSPPLLLLAGDGPRRAWVEREVAASGMADRIRLLGDRDDVDWLLAACDAVVLPSDSEGLPVSVLEAMLAERPVVASAVGGLATLDPTTLALVKPGSAPALLEALTQVIGSEEESARLVGRALQVVHTRFESARMLEAYRHILAGMCLLET